MFITEKTIHDTVVAMYCQELFTLSACEQLVNYYQLKGDVSESTLEWICKRLVDEWTEFGDYSFRSWEELFDGYYEFCNGFATGMEFFLSQLGQHTVVIQTPTFVLVKDF